MSAYETAGSLIRFSYDWYGVMRASYCNGFSPIAIKFINNNVKLKHNKCHEVVKRGKKPHFWLLKVVKYEMCFHEHQISNCGTEARPLVGWTSFCSPGCLHSSAPTLHFSGSYPGLKHECWGASWAGLWSWTHFILAFLTHKLVCYLDLARPSWSRIWRKSSLESPRSSRGFSFFEGFSCVAQQWCFSVIQQGGCKYASRVQSMKQTAVERCFHQHQTTTFHCFIFPTLPPCQNPESNSQTRGRWLKEIFSLLWQDHLHPEHLDNSSSSRETFGFVFQCLSDGFHWRGDEKIPRFFCFFSFIW